MKDSENRNIDFNLLIKYLAKEASSEEQTTVSNWLSEDAKHQEELNRVKLVWELSALESFDKNAAWRNIERDITTQKKSFSLKIPLLYRVAAAIICIVVSYYAVLKSSEGDKWVTILSNDLTKEVILPDSSVVYLNRNSSIKYPVAFNKKERKVYMNGEVFFEVTKQNGLPFIVDTDNLGIKVLGTSFNVAECKDDGLTNVSVETGKVSVAVLKSASESSEAILLHPCELGVLIQKKNTLYKTNIVDDNYLSWKTMQLKFTNSRLESVIHTLNKVYNSSVVLENKDLGKCLLNATFDHKSLRDIIDVIALTYNLQVDEKDNTIRLHGEGCN